MTTDADYRLGYVVGAAWERPDIAARVALTYNSEIVHTLDALEAGFANTQFDTEVPASVNLEFQTGIAANTLLFGSVRYVDWSKFDITPPLFGSPLVDYSEDTVSYNLGIGRRFNDQWSGAVTLGYEAPGGGLVGNLGPTDGYTSIGVGATYTRDNMKITGGVRYVLIGDATTSTIGADFTDNTAIAAGIRIGYSF
jgi:long-subunit fatty acid transport protein